MISKARILQAAGAVLGCMLIVASMAARDTAIPLQQQIEDLKIRLALQEEFKVQQRDYNTQLDTHVTNHIDNIVREEGQQDQRIGTLESRVSVVYGIGDVTVWALGILVSVFFYYGSRRYRLQDEMEESVQEHGERLEAIEAACSLRHESREHRRGRHGDKE